MPKVSVIMPVYNAERYLDRALDSVIKQDFADFELICVDDGSTDGSLKILRDYSSQDERIRVIEQSNSGGSAARNTGLRNALGEYVMFIDADDLYARDIISHAYERGMKTGAGIVLYNFARFISKPTPMAVVNKNVPGRDIEVFTKDTYKDRFFNDFATITWNKLIKRSVITDNNLTFNEGLSHNHDVDFSIRLMLAADSYSWIDKVGYYYRSNEEGLTATKRSDPVNVLNILVDLNGLVVMHYPALKKSFDGYVTDMVVGTLVKYSADINKMKQVFEFSHKELSPKIRLNSEHSSATPDVVAIIESGEFDRFLDYFNHPKRKLQRFIRRAYDVVQRALARFAV